MPIRAFTRLVLALGGALAVGCGSDDQPAAGGAAGSSPDGGGATAGVAGGSGTTGGAANDAATDTGDDAAPDPLASLGACEADVPTLLIASKSSMPLAGSEGYTVPSSSELDALESSITALLAGDAPAAQTEAQTAGYELCRDGAIALYRPLVKTSGSASFAWRSGSARSLIVEAPHPLHDSGTLEQAVGLFASLNARAIVASGAHRCANSTASSCDGTTEACSKGVLQAYRESDMAHVSASFFHRAHVSFAGHYASALVVGVHGMADPGASISDGTTLSTSADSIVARLAAELTQAFAGSAVAAEPITTCNAYPGAPAVLDHLCGTTDVQGRHLNGSPHACESSATAASGRFLHLEQSPQVRDHAALVALALDAVAP